MISKNKIMIMIALIISGSVIYELPYLSYIYYDLLTDSLDINNTQLGTLMSIYGFIAMIGYFPGGWMADRIPAKYLLSFSLAVGGLLGIWFYTLPTSYSSLVIIYSLWGITTSLTFWAALMKATRLLGDSSEQGRLFGILEAGRGLLPVFYGLLIVSVFNYFSASIQGLKNVILCYTLLELLGALYVWMVIPVQDTSEGEKTGASLKDVIAVTRSKELWLLSLIIFSSYILYTGFSYFTPFITKFYGASASLAATVGLIRTYGLALFGGLISGYIADKTGSKTRVVMYANIIPVCCLLVLFLVPQSENLLYPVIGLVCFLGLVVFMTRGVYFAIVDEIKIPVIYSGAAMGFISLIGFMPEAFIYILFGWFLDTFPGIQGYYYIFSFMAVMAMLGFIVAMLLYRRIKQEKLYFKNALVNTGEM
ncbi:MFS transporter [Salmonella enterica subsp. diarizonae serovar 53:r:z35]|nr:MFS transporter [Salmonella enterica subsp. diarizonae serovar 53:r:z35]